VQRRWPWIGVGLMFIALTSVFVLRVLSERDRAQAAEASAIAERDRARQADVSSRRVSEFLVSVFDGSDPDAGSGNVPAATLVEQAVARIDDLADEPMAQSAMYATLARIQHLVGNPRQAQLSYQKAIAIERRLDRPLELASHLHGLATLELAALSGPDAERDARAALALREQYGQPLAIAESLGLLGRILTSSEQPRTGVALLERALRIYQSQDPRSLATATALERLADGYREAGDNGRAIEHLRLSLDLLAATGQRDHEHYGNVEHSLAVVLGNERRFDEAEAILRRLLQQSRQQAGEDNDDFAWQLAELGRLLVSAGKAPQALPLYADALKIAARKIGADSLSFAIMSNNAASAFDRSGDWPAAEAAYRRALEIMERSWPATDTGLAQIQLNFGRLLLRLDKLDEAGTRLLAAERVLGSGENLDNVTLARIDIAEWQLRSGKLSQAQAQLDRIAADLSGLTARLRAAGLRVRGLLHAHRGETSQALQRLIEAEELMHSELGDGDARSWLIRVDRAKLLIGSADDAQQREGQALMTDVLLHVEPLLAPDAPLLARLRAMRSGQ
jgi:tetratricopeptide (TPR) repeat protein